MNRLRITKTIFIFWFLLLVLRLGYWQIIKSGTLKEEAFFQHFTSFALSAPRGEIISRDGFPLVTNDENYLLYIHPTKLPPDISKLASIISSLPAGELIVGDLNQAKSSSQPWVPISNNISPQLKKTIESFRLSGIGFEPQPSRYYPEGSSAAYITGFVGKDVINQPKGYFGLEGFYDRQLTGKSGKLTYERDALGSPIVLGSQKQIPSMLGATLFTGVDRTIQFIAYQKLAEGIEKYQAESGTVTIMEPSTGNILAMVSLPGYDPKNYSEFTTQHFKNPVISDAYEPGSTFKTIIMSSALDAGLITPDKVCTTCSGPVVIADQTVRNWDSQYFPSSSMKDIILHSDNVGMVFVGRLLGKQRMIEYLTKFGFGKLTDIDLQDEASPYIRPSDEWHDIDLATASFGQGIAVTPLQMLTGFNVIANHGQLVKPRIVQAIEEQGVKRKINQLSPVTVISPEAARTMTEIMIYSIDTGQVRYYKPQGYKVAGKTGTAQVPISGHYDANKVIASFIGFAPADNPKFSMLVTLREPKTSPWGSTTAAPLWFGIAGELFRYLGIPAYN